MSITCPDIFYGLLGYDMVQSGMLGMSIPDYMLSTQKKKTVCIVSTTKTLKLLEWCRFLLLEHQNFKCMLVV